MLPDGYISVQDAAKQLGLSEQEVTQAATAAQVSKFRHRGVNVFKSVDLERIRAQAKPKSAPKGPLSVKSESTELLEMLSASAGSGDVDIDALLSDALASEDAEDPESGVFDKLVALEPDSGLAPQSPPPRKGAAPPPPIRRVVNTEDVLSGSGLFELDDLKKEMAGGLDEKSKTKPVVPAKPGATPAKPTPGAKPTHPASGARPPVSHGSGERPPVSHGSGARPPVSHGSGARPTVSAGPPVRPPTAGAKPGAPVPVKKTTTAAHGTVVKKPAGPPTTPPGSNRPAIASWDDGWVGIAPQKFADAPRVDEAAPREQTVSGAIVVDSVPQTFLDDALIDSLKGAVRGVNVPQRHPLNPLVKPDTAWEQGGSCGMPGTVIYDREDGCLKMWYHVAGKGGRGVGYATSSDGVKWQKSKLGVVKMPDGTDTNIVMAPPSIDCYAELLGVVKDPSADADQSYKAVFLYQNPATAVRGLKTAVSADGLHWTAGEALIGAITDTGHFVRDPVTGKFVIYGRLMRQGRRCVQRIESDDFLFWSNGEPVLEPAAEDPPADDMYALGAFAWGRRHLGWVQMFHGSPDFTSDLQLAVSRDGWKWERAAGRATAVPCGPTGSWDRCQIAVSPMPVAVGDRDLWFYYGGRVNRHTPYSGADRAPSIGAIGAMRIRRDGFVHIEASYDGGTLVTQPIVLRSLDLRVNVSSSFGSLQVQLLDGEGRPVADYTCPPVIADGVDVPVTWTGDRKPTVWLNRPVRLRFTLKNARLYAFRTV